MTVHAWRCSNCNSSMLLTETEHLNTLLAPNHSCGLALTNGVHTTRCDGTWEPFAQWAAEAAK